MVNYLVYFFNMVIDTGQIPSSWRQSCFILLHKGGATQDPNNWRPIALLSIIYKIFGRLILSRIKGTLDKKQAEEQFGFQDKKSTSDALIIAETMISRSIECNTELWIISVDLRKSFDRVEHGPMFAGLRKHGLSCGYVQLLREIYSGQTGLVNDAISFPITRGVRQGDILSPILFNSALENAMQEWKAELSGHGFALDEADSMERLTNIRFADDILLFGKSLEEAIDMIERLVRKLREYGLELNIKKTKMMATTTYLEDTTLIDTQVGFIELLGGNVRHKYLGREWPGNLIFRSETALSHRISCAWAAFKRNEATMKNRCISLRGRLRLFAATVSPSALYGLNTVPMTAAMQSRLDILQRKMLRSIIGWRVDPELDWEENGRRMKHRMERAQASFFMAYWSEYLTKVKLR